MLVLIEDGFGLDIPAAVITADQWCGMIGTAVFT